MIHGGAEDGSSDRLMLAHGGHANAEAVPYLVLEDRPGSGPDAAIGHLRLLRLGWLAARLSGTWTAFAGQEQATLLGHILGVVAASIRDKHRPATIYDVARMAGVSHQTVARFLRGEGVRERTRTQVEAALATLNYRPNQLAKALATRRSYRIGAFVHAQAQWALLAIMDGAAAEARRAGYVLDLVTVDPEDPASVSQAVEIMVESSLAGAVILAASDSMLQVLDASQVSCPVIVERSARKNAGRHPEPDFALGVEHLVELGHRRFFHIAGPLDWPASRARRKALHSVAREHGGKVVAEAEGDWSAAGGYEAMAAAFNPRLGATAIVCANDHMALGALNWLAGAGLRVPADLSVIGFDNLPDGAYYVPPLTTVSVDNSAFGRNIIQRLFRELGMKTRVVPMRGELVIRGTTGPADDA